MARLAVVAALAMVTGAVAPSQGAAQELPRTHAEATGWTEVTPHAEVVAFYDGLTAASGEIRVREFGRSAAGRVLLEAVVARPMVASPVEAHASGKPIVLVNAQVHGDEQASKEALMLLARELVLGSLNPLLDQVIFVLSPQLNPDGAEAGEWGSRNNLLNRNVNRDYLRLDNPETRAFVPEVLAAWRPHVIVDSHELIGPPRIYDFYTSFPRSIEGPTLAYDLTRHELVPAIVEALEAEGFDHFPYHRVTSALAQDPSVGVSAGTYGARALSSYGGARAAITVLYESVRPRDARLNLESRTLRHQVAMTAMARFVAENASRVVETVRAERAELVARGSRYDPADSVGIRLDQLASRELDYRMEWQGELMEMRVPLLDSTRIALGRIRPVGYLLEPEAVEAARHLALHGVQVERVLAPSTAPVPVERYRIRSVTRDSGIYEGYVPRSFETEVEEAAVDVAAGSYVVRMDQPDARIIAHLLEPEDENSLASMGWFATRERPGAALPVHRLRELPALTTEGATAVDAMGRTRWLPDGAAVERAGSPAPAPRPPAAAGNAGAGNTGAENTGNGERLTPHTEVVAFYRSLAARSPWVSMREIGRTRQGRPLHQVTLARPAVATPQEAHASGKPVLFIGAQVHGDEPAGKEALMQVARELVEGPLEELLDQVVFVFVPQMNPDGAETGPWGLRNNPAGYNINRDYLRLDNPETRAIVEEVLLPWRPHVVVDAHELGGPPRVYDFYTWHPTNPHGPRAPMALAGERLIPGIVEALEEAGYSHIIYHTPGGLNRLADAPETGIAVPVYGRTLNDYAASRGLATVLYESLRASDARVDLADRARRHQVAMEALIRTLAQEGDAVREAIRDGVREMAERGGRWDEADSIAVLREPVASRTVEYRVAEYRVPAEGGGLRPTGEIITVEAPLFDSSRVTLGRTRPVAYLVEPHRGDLVRALRAHGILVERLQEPASLEVESFRIESLELDSGVYEGYVPQRFRTRLEEAVVEVEAGAWVVRGDQAAAALVFHLLEPDDENSLAITGAFLSEARVGGVLPVHRLLSLPAVPRRVVP